VQENHFQVTSMSSWSLNSSLPAILLDVNPLVRRSISLSLLRRRKHGREDRSDNVSETKETSYYHRIHCVCGSTVTKSFRRRDELKAVEGGGESNAQWIANTLTPSFHSFSPPSPRSVLPFVAIRWFFSFRLTRQDEIMDRNKISKMMLWKISPHYFILLMLRSPGFNVTIIQPAFVAATQFFLSLL